MTQMVSQEKAENIAHGWIQAWNSHDLDAIMAHYAEEVEFTSPLAISLMGSASGTLKGKPALRSYFRQGLQSYVDLKFELEQVMAGVGGLVVCYRSVKGMPAVEVMLLNQEGKVKGGMVFYNSGTKTEPAA